MSLAVGDELPVVERTATLHTSVAYAGASGDLNPLHYDRSFAEEVSPTGGIIAHGMFAMGLASRALAAALGGPEDVLAIDVRFTRPWPLGATATFGGTVTALGDDGIATVGLWGRTTDGDRILRGTARVRV